MEVLCDVCLSFVSMRVRQKGKGICAEENGPVSRSMEG